MLRRVVGGLSGAGAGAGDIVEVLRCWETVVGARVAAHARPRKLRGSVLQVDVDEPGWATQLRYLRGQIVVGINNELGRELIVRIELRVRRA